MAFQFSLAGLLRLRLSLERAEREKLLLLLAEMMQARSEMLALDAQMRAAAENLRVALNQGLSGAELQLAVGVRQQNEARRTGLLRKLAGLELRRRKQVESYRRARMQREILDSLKVRQLALYELERKRAEQRRVDEAFLLSHPAKADE